MITGNTEVNKWRRVSAGSLTIRYTGYLTNPFSKLKSRRPPLYKGQTGQKRKHYFLPVCALTLTSTENERVGDQNSAFVDPQNLVGYLFDGEIVVFIGENPPKIQIHAYERRARSA